MNEFILERNVCYQDSITESLSQELLNRSTDSQSQQYRKDSKSLEKSIDSELKSSKDVQSAILDSKVGNLVGSGFSNNSTNANMTNSNFTTNSNMTNSIDIISTGYPSSGDILSSSIDLDMKFDHFGESQPNIEIDVDKKRELKRMEVVDSDDKIDTEFEFQHVSDVFFLFENHSDPQIRGLVRVCMASYLVSSLDLSHGDYNRWRNYTLLPKEISECITVEKIVDVILKVSLNTLS